MKKTLLTILICITFVLLAAETPSQSGGSFVIERSTIAGGGNVGSGGIFVVTSSMGEAVSGMTGTGGGFEAGPGFWNVWSTGYSITGSVVRSDGRGITNAAASLTGGPLQQMVQIRTTRLGGFRFDNLQPGFTYTVTVSARRFTFSPDNQKVLLDNTAEGLTFIAVP
jgi:hypothetical protein